MKSSYIKRIATGMVCAASMVLATGAQANCNRSAQIVERVISYSTGLSYVYFRPRTALTNSVYYYCRVNDGTPNSHELISVAASAKTARTEVNASGNAGSCPTSGTGRYMGNCYYIYMLN